MPHSVVAVVTCNESLPDACQTTDTGFASAEPTISPFFELQWIFENDPCNWYELVELTQTDTGPDKGGGI